MTDADLLTVRALAVRFPGAGGERPQHVDLRVEPDESVLLLGPSGCGKSSLLRSVAGVIPDVVDADVYGSILIDGHSTEGRSIAQIADDAGFLAQDPLDSVVLARVDDEVAFGLENLGLPPAVIRDRVASALHDAGCAHLAERDTATLSGGELQRVALAATLAREPRLLLLDEPTSMLDPAAASETRRRLTGDGRATLLVEHLVDDLSVLPARTVVLDRSGAILADGPTTEVLVQRAPEIAAAGCRLPYGVEAALALGVRPTSDDIDRPERSLERLAAALGPGALDARRDGHSAEPLVDAAAAAFRAGRSRRSPVVVASATLSLRPGSVTAVLGRNGSGKTSAFLGIAGLLPHHGGRLHVAGKVAMVFQHPEHQFLRRSVLDEICFGSALDPDGARAIIDAFGLGGLEEHDPFRLSGGQQRRLSIAIAAAQRPDVLLLDEPTFGQDAAHGARLAGLIRGLADDGLAVGMITHDLRLVGAIADAVCMAAAGVLGAPRPVEEVLRDDQALEDAGLRRPPILTWWARREPEVGLGALLGALDRRTVRA
ncbi:ABC transporter ATP-binding protein [Cumulibacter manganitolerans]|uniref:ABC transporter ATP-binding protein n=1 Tax=Cumulibacter manganitolerans TaxID=1884992 RepID=UPI0012954EE9|nr:ABC transporter ATP-binding protein [Cumulibacter manganitolerans]